jgi:hypothetical protein
VNCRGDGDYDVKNHPDRRDTDFLGRLGQVAVQDFLDVLLGYVFTEHSWQSINHAPPQSNPLIPKAAHRKLKKTRAARLIGAGLCGAMERAASFYLRGVWIKIETEVFAFRWVADRRRPTHDVCRIFSRVRLASSTRSFTLNRAGKCYYVFAAS